MMTVRRQKSKSSQSSTLTHSNRGTGSCARAPARAGSACAPGGGRDGAHGPGGCRGPGSVVEAGVKPGANPEPPPGLSRRRGGEGEGGSSGPHRRGDSRRQRAPRSAKVAQGMPPGALSTRSPLSLLPGPPTAFFSPIPTPPTLLLSCLGSARGCGRWVRPHRPVLLGRRRRNAGSQRPGGWDPVQVGQSLDSRERGCRQNPTGGRRGAAGRGQALVAPPTALPGGAPPGRSGDRKRVWGRPLPLGA